MAYIECFIMPVRTSERALYDSIVAQSAVIYRELGVLSVTDCWGDNTPPGNLTSFPQSVQLQPDETVALSMLTFRDRPHRDEVMGRIENDMRLVELFMQTPLDGRRMIMGGFDVSVQA